MKKEKQKNPKSLKMEFFELKAKIKKYMKKVKSYKWMVRLRKKIHAEIHSKIKFSQKQMVIAISLTMIFSMGCGVIIGNSFLKKEVVVKQPQNSYIETFLEAYDAIIENYYGKVDQKKLMDGAINGMTEAVGDPYTSYMDEEETNSFNTKLNGQYEGVGIYMERNQQDIVLKSILPDSPALKAGLKPNDILISVDDLKSSEVPAVAITQYIRESKKQTFTFLIKRGTETFSVDIAKTILTYPSVWTETFIKNSKKIGYLELNLFADNTASQFKTKLEALETSGMDSLIIDLRDNVGGYMRSAIDITSMFLKKGEVILGIENNGKITLEKDETEEARNYKVVLLINGGSASASEIMAAAFKEVYKAELVGTNTFGKGTVQQPFTLKNGGIVKVTTEKWLTPSGKSITTDKVTPTTLVEFDNEQYSKQPNNENDNQLQAAIKLLAK